MEEHNAKTPKDTVLCCLICRRRMAIKNQTRWETVTRTFFEWFILHAEMEKAYACCDLCLRGGTASSLRALFGRIEELENKLKEKENEQ